MLPKGAHDPLGQHLSMQGFIINQKLADLWELIRKLDPYSNLGIQLGGKDGDFRDSCSTISLINILESLDVIEISGDETEEESWNFGSETSNSNDLDYKTKGWNRKRKQEKELDIEVLKHISPGLGLLYMYLTASPTLRRFAKVLKQLNMPQIQASAFDENGDIEKLWEILRGAHKIGKPEPLFKELVCIWLQPYIFISSLSITLQGLVGNSFSLLGVMVHTS
ncbi:hypothetical protein Cgig2_008373 [Carnegiea gigantea]|uniref:Uncharacterized protein n=1 Tax=Carnegiea gigantea TaxID=171969 RepID=A0A9Q1GPJ9_9CARY|nr:hypothetical protein Cgig2_008373 [Carnegiea gigantea]